MKVLITGANSGMGWECAKEMGHRGHDLLLTVRDEVKAAELKGKFPYADRIKGIYTLDLTSFSSVFRAAMKIFEEHHVIDVFLFNAGVMTPPYGKTSDGFETQFQANYLGHFYLFQLLQERLLTSAVKKVVSISSLSSEKGTCSSVEEFELLARCGPEGYDAMKCYRESKLAQVLFTRELDRRYGALGLRSFAVHPGVVNTNLFYRNQGSWYKFLLTPFVWLAYRTGFVVTPRRGASTALALVTGDFGPGGRYWAGKKLRKENPLAEREALCRDLWDWSLAQLPAVPGL